jgi:hypothetical protein
MNSVGLTAILNASVEGPVPSAVAACAHDLRRLWPQASAILTYGSVLRGDTPADTLIDFYVLVDGAAGVSANPLLRLAGHLVPPNVYYGEVKEDGHTWRYKCAVVTVTDFAAWMSPQISNPYFWARFCQPCRLVWTANTASRSAVIAALAEAATTAYRHARHLLPHGAPLDQWRTLFRATYATELRPEAASRADQLVGLHTAHFTDLSQALSDVAPLPASWAAKRWLGKAWSLLRLAKAAFTFRGGVDYAAWKIERHSGVKLDVKDWNRRHPLLSALLYWRFLRRKKALK